jgi:hypothetical protein
MRGMTRDRWALFGLGGLWIVAVLSFVVSATRGLTAVRVGQVVSGFCIVFAGMLLYMDWMGVATAMGERSSRRWRKRLNIAETRDPAVAARQVRIVAWWWIGFGALVVFFGVTAR